MARKPAKPKLTELAATAKCGCGSGRPYGRCCKKRKIQWHLEDGGELVKSINLSEEAISALKGAEADFEDIFGRKPRRDDPVFIGQYHLSTADFQREALHAMRASRIPPHLIYAYQKTDRIVGDRKTLTPMEEGEYRDAMEEYYERLDSGESEEEILWPDTIEKSLTEILRHSQIVIGYFIDRYIDKSSQTEKKDIAFFVRFNCVNFARSLRAIHVLLERDVSFEAFASARVLFENLLSASYLYKKPSHASCLLAQIGIHAGTRAYKKTRRGHPMISEIIELATGEIISIPSKSAQAEELGGLFSILYANIYSPLSSFLHSDPSTFVHFLKDGRFNYLDQDFTEDVLIVSLILTIFFLECLLDNIECQAYLKRDLEIMHAKIYFNLRTLSAAFLDERGPILAIFESEAVRISKRSKILSAIFEATKTRSPAAAETRD